MTRLRLTVAGAALVAAGTAPFAAPAQAFTCSPEVQVVCTVVGIFCRAGSLPPPALQYQCNLS
jgi:hypothetical protein